MKFKECPMKRVLFALVVLTLLPSVTLASDRYRDSGRYHGGYGYRDHGYRGDYGHRGHSSFGFSFNYGYGGYDRGYYGRPYYAPTYYRPVYIERRPVIVERYYAPSRYYYDDCRYYRPSSSYGFSFGYYR
jgi:hypothetical protein